MDKSILTVNSVQKQFASVRAVNNLSFNVKEREIFALLGPNGAGKTTMVRMLLNIIKPDVGSIEYAINGTEDPVVQSNMVGYLPEERGLYQDVPVIRTLIYMGVIRGLERTDAHKRALYWLERFELKDRAHEKVEALSKGNQQKVQFIASIIHSPRFAILDEPFSGLDPINQEVFLHIIRELCDRGTTVLLSAHQMQLVESIADRILLINNGKEVLTGTLDELRLAVGMDETITVVFTEENPDITLLTRHPSIKEIQKKNGNEYKLFLKDGKSLSDLLQTLGASYAIKDIHTRRISLHDIFLQAVHSTTKGNHYE